MRSSDAGDSRIGLTALTFSAGLLVAVHVAPGPDFAAWTPWSGVVKVAHGYLAYMGVNAGVTMGALARSAR